MKHPHSLTRPFLIQPSLRSFLACLGRIPLLCALALLFVGFAGCGSGTEAFRWEVTRERVTIMPGDTATYTVTIKSKSSDKSKVALRGSGWPADATATFSPQPIGSTGTESTLTIQTTPLTEIGTYNIRVFATEENDTEREIDVLLIVSGGTTGADFSLEVEPASYTFTGNLVPKTFSYFVRPLSSFSGTVAITASGVPSFMQVLGPNPSSVTMGGGVGGAGGTLTVIPKEASFGQGPFDLTLTATSGNITHTRTIHITPPI
jgi:hypothetical protein